MRFAVQINSERAGSADIELPAHLSDALGLLSEVDRKNILQSIERSLTADFLMLYGALGSKRPDVAMARLNELMIGVGKEMIRLEESL